LCYGGGGGDGDDDGGGGGSGGGGGGIAFNINFSRCSVSETICIASRFYHFRTVRFMPHSVFILNSADTWVSHRAVRAPV